jgi:hypothetical protein
MSTPAERQRKRRARLSAEGIETVSVVVPVRNAPALRELARYLCEHPDHELLPAARLPSGRFRFIKG